MRNIQTEKLIEVARTAKRVLILPHNDPDPDAIASSLALAKILRVQLNIQTKIAYGGIIGRAENRALVEYLDNPLHPLVQTDFNWADAVALVDTQPGAGNNPLPEELQAAIVIDHHPVYSDIHASSYIDITSGYGACSSILTEYLQTFGIVPGQAMSTALFYGVKTDTRGLTRDTFQPDIDSYLYLLPKIDLAALARIEYAPVPDSYFHTLVKTMHNARRYDRVVVAYCGKSDYPDMAAEMADILSRVNNAEWVICTCTYQEILFVSVRTKQNNGNADTVIKAIVGLDGTAGGHGMIAGGQIPLHGKTPQEKSSQVHLRALRMLGVPEGILSAPLITEACPDI